MLSYNKSKVILFFFIFNSMIFYENFFAKTCFSPKNILINAKKNVYLIEKTKFSRYLSAGAIVFHNRNINFTTLPLNRHSNQLYVFLNAESPIYTLKMPDEMNDNYFNISMTYRSVYLFFKYIFSNFPNFSLDCHFI